MLKFFYFVLIAMGLCSCNSSTQQRAENNQGNNSLFMLVGSYSSPDAEGIKLFAFNQLSGEANYVSGIKGISNPSYLTPSADGCWVYAVGEDEVETASAHVISLDTATGKMALLDSKRTYGAAPCYIALSPREDFVVTANYNGGNISIFGCKEKGKLTEPQVVNFDGHGVDSERQEQAHLHCIGFAPDERSLFAVDLGSDCIHVLPVKQAERGACRLGEVEPVEAVETFVEPERQSALNVPAGSGPRHFCFSRNQKYVYLITELSGDVIVMEYQGNSTKIIQTIKADTLGAKGSADIHLSPDGRFLYASNRLKGDGLAIFKVDSQTGLLEKVGYQLTGVHPRNFIISPNGKYLLVACRFSNAIEIYEINQQTGLLTPTGRNVKTDEPSCLKFVH